MLRIMATAFKNQPLERPFGTDFKENGGTIGRSTESTIILPDDKRYISRIQASVRFTEGRYLLSHHGSAIQTLLNGEPVPDDSEVELRDGDELRIADYVLQVSLLGNPRQNSTAPDPFADLFSEPLSDQSSYRESSPRPSVTAKQSDGISGKPLEAPRSNASSSSLIPDDFDPFAETMTLNDSPAPVISEGMHQAPASGPSLDETFGLRDDGSNDPLAFFGSGAASESERRAIPAQSRNSVRSTSDHAPLMDTAFRAPRPQLHNDHARHDGRAEEPNARSATSPDDMVLSWQTAPQADSAPAIKSVSLPPAHDVAPPVRRPEMRGADLPGASVESVPGATQAHKREGAVAELELLRAFLAGAGIPEDAVRGGLTPESARLLGQLLHEAVRGTLDLLLARALTKREIRADVTVIVARENNPLKFSPNADAALRNLISPQGAGFMNPMDAMRDAFNDLRSHQFGFMAGMRGALEGVLARFEPAQLEQTLTRNRMRDALLPATRRARLWQLYEELYRDIMKEAEDDFQTLFGREFLRAYEAQIAKLEAEDAATTR